MIIYNSTIIVWIGEKGHIFNDVSKADKFFKKADMQGLNPEWQRIKKKTWNLN